MKRGGYLKRYTRLNPISPRKRSRIGKFSKTVRLAGPDVEPLRFAVFSRANGRCELRLPGCRGFAGWDFGQLAHTKSRGSGGGDVESNAKWACDRCHMKSHNCNGKPIKVTKAEARGIA